MPTRVRLTRATLCVLCFVLHAHTSFAADAKNGVKIYSRHDFDQDEDQWKPTYDAQLSTESGGVTGDRLKIICGGKWGGTKLFVPVEGSQGLKMALHMEGTADVESVGVNVYDQAAGDNTTTFGPRFLRQGDWTPILYHLDQFRYNSSSRPVRRDAKFASVQFLGPLQPTGDTSFSIDNFVIYRGSDTAPPAKVRDLKAVATANGVELSWSPALDNVATMVYVVSRAEGNLPFQKIAECVSTTFVDDLVGKSAYRYRVLAVDFEENLGPWSRPVLVRSVSEPRERATSREERDGEAYGTRIRAIHASGKGRVRRGHGVLFGDSLTGATVYPRHCESALLMLTVQNHGFAGKRTSFGRMKIDEILQQQNPEFAFILFGTNNAKSAVANRAAMADLQSIIAACERRGTVAILGTIPPRGFSDPRSLPEAGFNQQLAAMCRRLKVPTAYIFEGIQSSGPRRQFLSGDGVHWTSAGMNVAARAWGRALEQVQFALRDRPDGESLDADPVTADSVLNTEDVDQGSPGQNRSSAPQRSATENSSKSPATSKAKQAAAAGEACPVCGFTPRRTRYARKVGNVRALEHALRTARPNTTIWIQPGLYRLNQTLDVRTPRIVLRSVGGDPTQVFLVGGGVNERAVGVALSIRASNVTVHGMSIGNVRFHGVQVRGENEVQNVVLHGLHIFDTGQQLVKGSTNLRARKYSRDCVVACSLFDYEKGAPGSYTNGVDVLAGQSWIVRDNVFRSIHGPLAGGGGAGPAILFWRDSRDTIIERNVIVNCFRGIALGLEPVSHRRQADGETYYDHIGGVIRNNIVWNLNAWADEGIEVTSARDVRIEHNTVYVTGRLPWSVSVRFPASSALVRNNLSNRSIQSRDGGDVREEGNVTNAQSEWFVNLDELDMRLNGAHRDAIDVGVPIDDVSRDFQLQARPVGEAPDAGAFEFLAEEDVEKEP